MFKLYNIKNKTKIIFFKENNLFFLKKNNIYIYNSLNFLDVNYIGKTYKWKIKFNFFKFIFNRSHKTYFFLNKNFFFKKLLKSKFRFFFNNFNNFNIFKILLFKVRKYNIFTQRGLKFKNSLILKKKGKISTYK